jgi:hypothetical protein
VKKLILIIAAALCSGAHAQAGRLVFDTALGPMYFIETAKVQDITRVWLSLERTERGKDGIASDKMLFELDCGAQTVRTTRHSYSGPRGTGALVESQQSSWAPPTPGVVSHKLQQHYCR